MITWFDNLQIISGWFFTNFDLIESLFDFIILQTFVD